jgi:hypothetical protein
MRKYYTGTQTEVQEALDKINTNSGFPNESAQTWANIQPTANDGEFYIEAPVNGYGGLTGEQMMDGVTLTLVDSVTLPDVESEL